MAPGGLPRTDRQVRPVGLTEPVDIRCRPASLNWPNWTYQLSLRPTRGWS